MAHAARHSPGLGGVSGQPLLPCRIWPSSAVVVGLVLICTLVGLWSTSSSLCTCSDKLLRSWSAYSGVATDSVLLRLGVPVWACGCALTVVDVPVVRQRQVPTAFRVLLRVWKRSLLCAASRYSH